MEARVGNEHRGAEQLAGARLERPIAARGAPGIESGDLDEVIRTICTRDLEPVPYPYVHVGVEHLEPLNGEPRDVVTATGAREDAAFEPLGIAVGDTGDPLFWRQFLCGLLVRGLRGVRVVASGHYPDLGEAVARVLPAARWHLAGRLEDTPLEDVLLAVWAADECERVVAHRKRGGRDGPAPGHDAAHGAPPGPRSQTGEPALWPPDPDVPWMAARRRASLADHAEASTDPSPAVAESTHSKQETVPLVPNSTTHLHLPGGG